MLILLPSTILIITAVILIILSRFRPGFRFTWLIAVCGALLALILVFIWQAILPFSFTLYTWEPVDLFPSPISFIADQHSWIYSISLAGLAIAILLTTAIQEYFPSSLWWAGTLGVIAIGILAVSAGNPLTLILLWTAIDFIEFSAHFILTSNSVSNKRDILPFAFRIAGTLSLVWAGMVGLSAGTRLDFASLTGQAAVLWVIAVGLRLSSFFFKFQETVNSGIQSTFSTALRFVSAASSLILLARLPLDVTSSASAPYLLILAALISLYSGWKWIRSADGISGSSYWIMGVSALAGSAALRGNPFGATAWGSILILSGGPLFLNSIRKYWTDRILLVNCWALGTLPFSMGAVAWLSTTWFQVTLPLLILAQAWIIAGYITKIMKPADQSIQQALPAWTRVLYPPGLGILIGLQIILGVWGWEGAMRIGVLPAGLVAVVLAVGMTLSAGRIQRINLIPEFWITSVSTWRDGFAEGVRGLHRLLNRISVTITEILEGDGGVMWTLLFLVLFVSLMTQGRP